MPGTLPPERPPSSHLGDAPTVPRIEVKEGGSGEFVSSAFLEELGPSSQASEARAASLLGTLISGRYRADELLGQGGMGAVFGGEQIHLRKRVAIKVLHPDTERLPGLVDRFEREAVAGAHVQHPNVAAAIDFGKLDDGSYFLVLEYVAGTPLADLLDRGPLAPLRALRIARQMANALAAVHDKGIVHRDIKPQNTLLGADDHVKIIDFGLAKVDIGLATGKKPARPEVPLTAAGVIFGTPAYLAPEAALGMGAVDARSDLYALGVTLYEMLCGRLPFDGSDPASIFRQQRLQDPPPMRERAPGVPVPEAAERVAMRLVQRDPANRYQSAREATEAIDDAIQAVQRPAPPPRRRRPPPWAFVAVAAGSLALGIAAAIVLHGPRAERSVSSAAPSPPPEPSAAASAPTPSAAASPAPAEIEGVDVAGWRARFLKASQIKDWVLGAKAFLALAQIDPELLDDAGGRARVVAMAAGIAHEGRSELADAVFDALGAQLRRPRPRSAVRAGRLPRRHARRPARAHDPRAPGRGEARAARAPHRLRILRGLVRHAAHLAGSGRRRRGPADAHAARGGPRRALREQEGSVLLPRGPGDGRGHHQAAGAPGQLRTPTHPQRHLTSPSRPPRDDSQRTPAPQPCSRVRASVFSSPHQILEIKTRTASDLPYRRAGPPALGAKRKDTHALRSRGSPCRHPRGYRCLRGSDCRQRRDSVRDDEEHRPQPDVRLRHLGRVLPAHPFVDRAEPDQLPDRLHDDARHRLLGLRPDHVDFGPLYLHVDVPAKLVGHERVLRHRHAGNVHFDAERRVRARAHHVGCPELEQFGLGLLLPQRRCLHARRGRQRLHAEWHRVVLLVISA
ncbi:MAG: serine/threonine-protein kinase [Minicystis sp.]